MAAVVIGALALLFGIAVGSFGERCEPNKRSIGIAMLGLMAGFLIGLSQSPVIASIVTASFGLVATLASKYVAGPPAQAGGANNGTLDDWLVPFVALAIAGLLCGIVIRVNELLLFREFRTENLRIEYERQGFTPAQVDRIMDGHATVLASSGPPAPTPSDRNGLGVLNKKELATPSGLLDIASGFQTDAERVAFIYSQAERLPKLRAAIDRLRTQGKNASDIMEALKAQLSDGSTLDGD